jgi:hypothetical protein
MILDRERTWMYNIQLRAWACGIDVAVCGED